MSSYRIGGRLAGTSRRAALGLVAGVYLVACAAAALTWWLLADAGHHRLTSALCARWWTAVGPLAVLALFVGVSVPMMGRRSVDRRPGYREHMRAVPALLPRLRR